MTLTGHPRLLGRVISGSLSQGLDIKLESGVSVEEMAIGRFVLIQGQGQRYLGKITDIRLGALDAHILTNPPHISDPFIAEVVMGTGTYGQLEVLPEVILDEAGVKHARTIPPPFSQVWPASDMDVECVFGQWKEGQFWIGNPLDMETKIRLDTKLLVERSNGIFGKSGTGKTFLTRLLLIGIIQSGAAVNIVFDMHNDYGWWGRGEKVRQVKGLRQIFGPTRVSVFTLDKADSLRRGVSTDFDVRIAYEEIQPEDIATLQETLNITERGLDACYEIAEVYSKSWLERFLNTPERQVQEDLEARAQIPIGVLRALKLSLNKLRSFHFLASGSQGDSVDQILNKLKQGISVILEFGRYRDNIVAYILVANLLSRRIHEYYVQQAEQAAEEGGLKPLVITIEEAHKFLSPELARQTIFGTIAREMRKYNVTLMVVDQRPSGIDEEVMSQLGTKVVFPLDNERDIESALSGVASKSKLKSLITTLESRPTPEALIFGHAVIIPVVIRVREYGSPKSYRELGFLGTDELRPQVEQDIEDLF